jgi:hypothetical protein
MDDSDECACGHTRDEHDEQQACTVYRCPCFYFDLALED